MKKMNKIFTMIMAIAILTLVGCGTSDANTVANNNSSPAAPAVETPAPVEEPTTTVEETTPVVKEPVVEDNSTETFSDPFTIIVRGETENVRKKLLSMEFDENCIEATINLTEETLSDNIIGFNILGKKIQESDLEFFEEEEGREIITYSGSSEVKDGKAEFYVIFEGGNRVDFTVDATVQN